MINARKYLFQAAEKLENKPKSGVNIDIDTATFAVEKAREEALELATRAVYKLATCPITFSYEEMLSVAREAAGLK
jgi:hypothetical protein